MTDQNKTIIDSLLQLTRKGDVLSLNDALQQCIVQLVPSVTARVYERSGTGDKWRMANVGAGSAGQDAERCSRELKEADADRLRQLKSEDSPTCIERDGGSLVAAFLIGRGTDTLAGSIVQGECSDSQFEALQVLMEAYGNLYRTLYRGSHDALTGLLNRNTFDDRIRMLVEDASERHLDFSTIGENSFFVILDIDHFKRINDNFGHLYGDEVLLLFAQIMGRSFRDFDLLFRFGGEEFVVILNALCSEDAFKVLERFRQTLESTSFPQVGQVTCSIGYTHLDISRSTDVICDRADKALYFAKQNGRNQVCYFESLLAQGLLTEDERSSIADFF